MTWVKLDDQFPGHPKVIAAGPQAGWLYVCGLCYCSRYLTDGFIPDHMLEHLAKLPKVRTLAERLVELGLWDEGVDGWLVHDYERHQRTREQVTGERTRGARRAALHRDPVLKAAVRERDGDFCRYCCKAVDWKNKRGAAGATYDHVDPDGPNVAENLVVACRGCNAAKRDRTPHEAGMVLKPIQVGFDAEERRTETDLSTSPPVLKESRPQVVESEQRSETRAQQTIRQLQARTA